jgi:8-oxo-dGTP pyrophosphatase MutT (NUDIX family)
MTKLIPDRWRAAKGVAAIITVRQRGYLLQLRDRRKGIWYPGYWGLFGGTVERGETAEVALRRELAEELALVDVDVRYFMSTDLTFAPAVGEPIQRDLFELRLAPRALARLRLGEGRAMQCWPVEALPTLQLAPADRLALDFHAAQGRRRAPRGR